jgi:methyl coenzyme M reductase subunit D
MCRTATVIRYGVVDNCGEIFQPRVWKADQVENTLAQVEELHAIRAVVHCCAGRQRLWRRVSARGVPAKVGK